MPTISNALMSRLDKIPNCTEENFQQWKSMMKLWLNTAGATYLVGSTLPAAVPADMEELDRES